MFCFLDLASAERACNWAQGLRSHFRAEYLAELHLGEADPHRDRFDANWISEGGPNHEWLDKYWNGEPFRGKEPIWETLIEGRAIVLGTKLRERAYEIIKKRDPDSLCFLEIARQAAWVGSDVGNVTAHLIDEGDSVACHYMMDMRGANDAAFIAKLQRFRDEGNWVNEADIHRHIPKGEFGKTMDLRRYEFKRLKAEMPNLKK
jgi:hypothetical protein